jgi:hypothetical protein
MTNTSDPLDVQLEDFELLTEVRLLAELMVAAAETDDPLAPATVDRLLGLSLSPRKVRVSSGTSSHAGTSGRPAALRPPIGAL